MCIRDRDYGPLLPGLSGSYVFPFGYYICLLYTSYGIVFHPDLIRGTSLGKDIKKYTFFSYAVNEALHLSDQEKEIVMDCLKKISIELEHGIDKHSKALIAMNIELLLNYCMLVSYTHLSVFQKASLELITALRISTFLQYWNE